MALSPFSRIIFTGFAIFLLSAPYVFAAEEGGRIAVMGIPLFSVGANMMTKFLSVITLIIVVALICAGILILISALSSFRSVPREAALSFGWNTIKQHKTFFVTTMLIALVFSNTHVALLALFKNIAPFSFRYQLEQFHFFSLTPSGDQLIFSSIGYIFSAYISAGIIQLALNIVRGKQARLSYLFVPPNVFIPFFIGTIIYSVVLWTGIVLAIVPGILFASTFFFWQYRYLDGGVSLIDSFKDSFAMTRGARKEVFLFWYLTQIVAMLGFFVLGVGFLFSYPVSMLALAFVYDFFKKKYDSSYRTKQNALS